MNTTSKGNDLEDRVFRFVKQYEQNGTLGKNVRVYQKHKYYSLDTESYKSVDVSIEIRENSEDKDPIFLTIIECKNLGRKVDISDIEEFNSKLEGIRKRAIRGVFVTTVGYSAPSLKYARNKQISLIRLNPEVSSGYEYVLKREINDPTRYYTYSDELLTNEQINERIVVFHDNKFTSLWEVLVDSYVVSGDGPIYNVPYIPTSRLDEICDSLRADIPIDKELTNKVASSIGLSISYSLMPTTHLGHLHLNTGQIELNDILKDEPRRLNFTLAHEIGHWILHRDIIKEQIDSIGENAESLEYLGEADNKRMEYQANLFASILLMPEQSFARSVATLFNKYSINRGRLYVDKQKCNIANYRNITSELANIFYVSKKAAASRMKSIGALEVSPDVEYYL